MENGSRRTNGTKHSLNKHTELDFHSSHFNAALRLSNLMSFFCLCTVL